MLMLAIAGIGPRDVADMLQAAPADGSWKAETFDGLPVGSKNYLVVIRRGVIVGGYDDCNGWSYEDAAPDKKGERQILSTLAECPADDLRSRYRSVTYSPRIQLLDRNDLRLSGHDHRGLFRRCKPDRQRVRCVPV
jgi:hypothetical protein